jgi:hypothetical protein
MIFINPSIRVYMSINWRLDNTAPSADNVYRDLTVEDFRF